jgi:hypothetical protein
LGLGKIRAEDFDDDERNPFKVQDNTEKILVLRELEREFKDLTRYEKETKNIHEKGVASKPDRTGTIRTIVNCEPSKKEPGPHKEIRDLSVKLMLTEMQKRKTKKDDSSFEEEMRANANKQKINIFDAQDSNILKHDTLKRLGYDEKALVPVDDKSETVSVRTTNEDLMAQRPKSIEYLNKCR